MKCTHPPEQPFWLWLVVGTLSVATAGAQTFGNNIKFSSGTVLAPTGGRFDILPSDGQRVGTNLFHSFSNFSLAKDFSAVFKTPADVTNVLARVTGTDPSAIDGTLRTELENSSGLSGANLYLINPHGIVFGPNAKLEVGGSFTATTADYVKLADGGRFDARNSANDVLTTAPVSAFGFTSASPAKITSNGATLEVAATRDISLIGGEIGLLGSTARAPGGGVLLFSAASAGEASVSAGFAPDGFSALAPITVSGGRVDADGTGGGRVTIRGAQLALNDATVTARTLGAVDGQGIDIRLTGDFSLTGGSLETSTIGSGAGGPISIIARNVSIDGGGNPRSGIFSETTGGAQDVDVTVDITHTYDGDLRAVLISPAGTRVVLFDDLARFNTIASPGRQNFAGTVFDDEAARPLVVAFSEDFAGRHRPLQPLSVFDRENLSGIWKLEISDVAVQDVGTLNGWTLTIDGSNFSAADTPKPIEDLSTLTATIPVDVGTMLAHGGRGGDIQIRADSLNLRGAAQISTKTTGSGAAGAINLNAPSVVLRENSVIRSDTEGIANAGDISLHAASLELHGGTRLSVSTSGIGQGGSLSVQADSITIDSEGSFEPRAGFFADTTGPGDAGDISVHAGSLAVLNEGELSSETTSIGRGGNISVDAGSVRLDAGPTARGITTGFLAETRLNGATGGDAGRIEVTATTLIIGRDAVIDSRTNTSAGSAGGIVIHAANLLVENGSILSETQAETFGGRAGDISIYAGVARLLGGGEILGGGYQSTGAGGNIRLVADALTVSGRNENGLPSQIDSSSSAGSDFQNPGRSGNVDILAGQVRVANHGEIVVTSGDIDFPDFIGGPSGSLRIVAENIEVAADATIAASTFSSNPGGSIDLRAANRLVISDGASISASTGGPHGTGRGGDIKITAGQLEIRDGGLLSVISRRTGAAGDLDIHATDGITLLRGGQISADSFRSGTGGSIHLESDRLVVATGSGIFASAGGAGSAGDIEISADRGITLRAGSRIATTATTNRAGQITVTSGGDIRLRQSEITVQSLAGDAGSIILRTPRHLVLRHSAIVAEAGGSGGDVVLGSGQLSLDASRISANAMAGAGGSITVQIPAEGVFGDARDFVIASSFIDQSSDSRISASSTFGVQGTLVISAPFVDLAGSLESLNSALFDASTQLRDQCARKLQQDFSSYLRLGRGGQPQQPEELGAAF